MINQKAAGLTQVREEIKRTEAHVASAAFYSAPWETQHLVLDRLGVLQGREERLAAEDKHTDHMVSLAQSTGDPVVATFLYLLLGMKVLESHRKPAIAKKVQGFPKTQAAAQDRLTRAEDTFWDHAMDCLPCFEGANAPTVGGLCWPGMRLWRELGNAKDTVRNWGVYDPWMNRGGYARHMANNWIAN